MIERKTQWNPDTRKMESTTPDVYRAICQVAKELSKSGIAKDKTNTQGAGFKFRGIDDVYNALSGVISGADLCILPRMVERVSEERQSNAGKPLFYVTVRAEFDFVSARDGSKHTVATYGEAMDSADKATNKAMSAAFKYACFQTFVIPTEGMDDADAHTPEPAPKAAPKPVPPAWHAKFKAAYEDLGEAAYMRVMGANGYAKASDIPDQKTAAKILAEMEKERPKKEGK